MTEQPKKDVSGLIYGLIKKVNLLEKRVDDLQAKVALLSTYKNIQKISQE